MKARNQDFGRLAKPRARNTWLISAKLEHSSVGTGAELSILSTFLGWVIVMWKKDIVHQQRRIAPMSVQSDSNQVGIDRVPWDGVTVSRMARSEFFIHQRPTTDQSLTASWVYIVWSFSQVFLPQTVSLSRRISKPDYGQYSVGWSNRYKTSEFIGRTPVEATYVKWSSGGY